MLGIDALPLFPIPHPLAGNLDALVAQKADGIVASIAIALTESSETLQRRFATQFTEPVERRLDGGAVCIDDVCALDGALAPPSN